MLKKKMKPEIDTEFDLTPPAPKKSTALTVVKKKKPVLAIGDLESSVPKAKKGKTLEQIKTKKPYVPKPENVAALKSIFGEDAQQMVDLLESGDDDNALARVNKRLIQSSINLIAQIEKGIHESNGRYGVHGYTGLVQTIRELMIDLQSTKDRGALGHTLAENILRPAFLDMAMSVMTEYATVAADAKDLMDDKTYDKFKITQKESRDRIAAFLQDQYMKMRDETISYLER